MKHSRKPERRGAVLPLVALLMVLLLAMVAFDILVDKSQKEEIDVMNDETILDKVNSLNDILSSASQS